jgi:hypothetical protein
MKFKGQNLEYPFECDPTDQSFKCHLFFEVDDEDRNFTDAEGMSRNFVTNQCKCALDGSPNRGYCSSVIGSMNYRRAMDATAKIQEQSKCHTLDRYNIEAQRDRNCGVGLKDDQFRFAVDKNFNVTYWPYV